MKEEKKEEEALPISADDLHLVDRTNPSMGLCPTCGNRTWYVVQDPEVVPTLPMGTLEGALLMINGHALVTLTCQQCGYLKSHIKAIFDGYVTQLKERPNDGG